jgi:hypothetical protein
MQRGEANNLSCAAQLRDFTGLRFGNRTPTDLDLFLDLGNKVFIVGEAKYRGAQLPFGQRLAIERLCDESKVQCFGLVLSHNQPPEQRIDFANAVVLEFRFLHQWVPVSKPIKCRAFIDAIQRAYER